MIKLLVTMLEKTLLLFLLCGSFHFVFSQTKQTESTLLFTNQYSLPTRETDDALIDTQVPNPYWLKPAMAAQTDDTTTFDFLSFAKISNAFSLKRKISFPQI